MRMLIDISDRPYIRVLMYTLPVRLLRLKFNP